MSQERRERPPFKLSDRTEFRQLVSGSGFHDVIVNLTTRVARFASAEAMVRVMIAGTPLGTTMTTADPQLLQRVIEKVTEGLSQMRTIEVLQFRCKLGSSRHEPSFDADGGVSAL